MAARNFAPLSALGRGLVAVPGSFAPNGSSAVSASSRKGPGWTVARTSAGLFTVTFSNKFVDLVAAFATLQLATGADVIVQLGTWTAASRALQIRVWDVSDAAVADIAADANNRINFTAWFSNTSLVPTKG